MRRTKLNITSLKEAPITDETLGISPYESDDYPVFGDLHGNVLYAINMMVRAGLIQLEPAIYDRLQTIYFSEAPLSPEQTTEFCTLMHHHIVFEHTEKQIIFLGDVFADRGRSDWLMLQLFCIMHEHNNHPILHFSNHDYAFLDYIFKDEITSQLEEVASAKDRFIPKGDYPGKRYQLLREFQSRSLYELIEMIESDEHPDVTFKTCKDLAIKYVIPSLQLISATVNDDTQTININTHAPVAAETVYAATVQYGLPYEIDTVSAYARTILSINNAWKDRHANEHTFLSDDELIEMYINHESDDLAVPLRYVAIRMSHNRPAKQYPCGSRLDIDLQRYSSPIKFHPTTSIDPAEILDKIDQQPLLEQYWKDATLTWTHGHSGQILSEHHNTALQTIIHSSKHRDEKKIHCDRLHNTAAVERPFQSHTDAAINLDTATIGREGSYDSTGRIRNLATLTPWTTFITCQGELTIAPLPANRQQEAIEKTAKQVLLKHLITTFCARIETLSEQLNSGEKKRIVAHHTKLLRGIIQNHITPNAHFFRHHGATLFQQTRHSIDTINIIIKKILGTLLEDHKDDELIAAIMHFVKGDYIHTVRPIIDSAYSSTTHHSLTAKAILIETTIDELLQPCFELTARKTSSVISKPPSSRNM